MTIDPTETRIVFNFHARDAPEIEQCLKTLFSTPMGTVALDRDFGIDFSILDQPIPVAQTKLRIELIQKVRKYEPRVNIDAVSYENDAINGVLIPKVVVAIVKVKGALTLEDGDIPDEPFEASEDELVPKTIEGIEDIE